MAVCRRTRGRGRPTSPLRAKLKKVLALSLSSSLATAAAAACRGASEPPSGTDSGAASVDAGEPPEDSSLANDGGICAPVRVEAGLFGEDGACGKFVSLPCGIPPALRGVGCNPSPDLCVAACPEGFFFICELASITCVEGGLVPDATVYLDCTTCLGNVGRRPIGLRAPKKRTGSQLGGYFARTAYMEAASVEAFRQLHTRLVSSGAPARLKRGALRAARDEQRHARTAATLARRYGAVAEAPEPSPPATLTFAEMALENAVEGCVRETFSALVTMHQAQRAGDARIAKAMRRIAEDEVRHAELAWAIHRWALPKLGRSEQERIRIAQAAALEELDVLARVGAWDSRVVSVAGVPDRSTEQRLVSFFGRTLFAMGDRRTRSPRRCDSRPRPPRPRRR